MIDPGDLVQGSSDGTSDDPTVVRWNIRRPRRSAKKTMQWPKRYASALPPHGIRRGPRRAKCLYAFSENPSTLGFTESLQILTRATTRDPTPSTTTVTTVST